MRYGHPDAGELLATVAEFLREDVVGSTTGRTRYHARVAAHVVAMVQREIASREGIDLAEGAWGHPTDDALAAAIADGDYDDRFGELLAALEPAVLERLRVANPRYEEIDDDPT